MIRHYYGQHIVSEWGIQSHMCCNYPGFTEFCIVLFFNVMEMATLLFTLAKMLKNNLPLNLICFQSYTSNITALSRPLVSHTEAEGNTRPTCLKAF